MRQSPWRHAAAPLQSAGALVPLIDAEGGQALSAKAHGTGFFVSPDGMFVTAGHVFDFPGDEDPPVMMSIFHATGAILMPVAAVSRHPGCDLAIGWVAGTPEQLALIRPMTLASTTLARGAEVAVLGYPRSVTEYKVDDQGVTLSRLRLKPDYHEGHIEEHHRDGLCLVRGAPAYLTSIVAKRGDPDLGGASGGPLIDCETLAVHGFLSSSSEEYSICTDIAALLDWECFELPGGGALSLRAMLRGRDVGP